MVWVAFAAVVSALFSDLITPLIAAIGGSPDFGGPSFTVNGSHFRYGAFVNALLSFVVVAAIVFFFVVKPVNALLDRFKQAAPDEGSRQPCPYCLGDIPRGASRCAFCTQPLTAGSAG